MKNNKLKTIVNLIFLFVVSLSFVSAQYFYSNYQQGSFVQYNQPTFQQFYSSRGINYREFWPVLDGECNARGDFIVNIRPGGCSPAVVRSDLLEEQNVPVFCKLDAVKLNPIIDIASLKSVGFKNRGLDKYIAGISYLPSQVALRLYQPVLNNPLMNDIGYTVIVLKRQLNESYMPDFVEANLTAVLTYDMKNIYGAGQTSFFLPVISEQDWNSEYNKYNFWKGRGYLRADWIDKDKAEIAVYIDAENIIKKIILAKGQTSDRIDMPGFYCMAGVRVQLKDLTSGTKRARLQVDDNEFWMVENEKFLDNCYVKSIKKIGAGGQVALRCQGKDYLLRVGISDRVLIEEDGNMKETSLGEAVDSAGNVYLAYIGLGKEKLEEGQQERIFAVLVKNPGKTEKINEIGIIKQDALTYITENFDFWMREANTNVKKEEKWYETDKIRSNIATALGAKKDDVEIIFNGTTGKAKIEKKYSGNFEKYKVVDVVSIKDVNYKTIDKNINNDLLEDYFAETSERAYDIVTFYGSEKDSYGDYYGAKALSELADLAGDIKKQASQLEILKNLIEKYSGSSYANNARAKLDELAYFNYENAGTLVTFGTESHYIKLLQVVEPGIDEASAVFRVEWVKGAGTSEVKTEEENKLVFDLEIGKEADFSYLGTKHTLRILSTEGQVVRFFIDKDTNSYGIPEASSLNIDLDKDKKDDVKIYVSNIQGTKASFKITNLQSSSSSSIGKANILGTEPKTRSVEGEQWFIEEKDPTNNEYIKILKLEDEQVKIEYGHRIKEDETKITAEQKYIKKGEAVKLRAYSGKKITKEVNLVLDEIKLKKLAQVSLISEMPNGVSEANFSVRIGIEKRAIELSPDKTKDRIENLNKSIEQFSKIVENLGKVVKVWKGACFATTGILIVKNLFSNMGGKALARQEVMKNYWKTWCAEQKSLGYYKSIEACYADKNSEIEKSVDNYASKISEMNSLADSLKGENAEITRDNYAGAFKDYVKANPAKVVDNKGTKLIDVFGGVENSDATIDRMVKNGDLRVEEMRDIRMAGELSSSQPEIGNKMLERNINPVYEVAKRNIQIASLESIARDKLKDPNVNVYPISRKDTNDMLVNTYKDDSGEYVVITTPIGSGEYDNKLIKVPIVSLSGNKYTLDMNNDRVAQVLNTNKDVENINPDAMSQILSDNKIGAFTKISQKMCNNKYLNPKIKFYETEPYKGMPAVVPIDTEKGWYAATKQIIPGFGMTPYKSSGQVSSLWLCNVGTNGREEFDILNDDLCIQLNYDTGQPQGQLMCLSEGEARQLAVKAKYLVEYAASQYKQLKPGYRKINLPGAGSFSVEKAVSSIGTECTDFMSPSDCNILFNVCDPVLCPSSRCNLGGSFYVDDVIQSGIIGSIALCLPNFGSPANGGVIVPVCLTGIYAGLDAYVSVLKAHKQCLEENLKTGKFIGICDEIYSIYLCEFFWRQGAPLLDIALPKLIEMLYTGGRTRGGGEYMTISSAWDNAQNSLKYFTDYYAVNAMKAFQARNTGEIGTEICKAFISSNYPDNKDMLDKLLEPENPVQFYAKFDEIAYSDATLPSTSQYKVYYHIFAGRDQGHYFQVYLKNPPETSYYAAQPYLYVDSGYIGIGQYATQTKDFTAPSGYKELCVRIDMKEECGFKQVTTEFAIDYLKDLYMKEQGTEEIISEKQCVSGSPSLYSLVNPNIQEAGQEMLQPAIYKRGLIRVCSTTNPGNATSPGRWKDVGYCSDTRIRCWLDTETVKEVIQDKNLEKETLKTAEEIMKKEDIAKGELWTEDTTNSQLKKAKDKFNEIKFEDIISPEDFKDFKAGYTAGYYFSPTMQKIIKLLTDLRNITTKGFFNSQKVEAMFLEFEVYNKLSTRLAEVMKVYIDAGIAGKTGISTPATSPAATPAASTPEKGFKFQQEGMFILKDGFETGWYLEQKEDNDNIFLIKDQYSTIIGSIFKNTGEIKFLGMLSQDKQDLQTNYKFNSQQMQFELKSASSSNRESNILTYDVTKDQACVSDSDCAGECQSDRSGVFILSCNNNICKGAKLLEYPAGSMGAALEGQWSCLENSQCEIIKKSLNNKYINYAVCKTLAEKIDCGHSIKLYNPLMGGLSFIEIIINQNEKSEEDAKDYTIYYNQDFLKIKSELPIFSGGDILNSFKEIKDKCGQEINTIVIFAHGSPGRFVLPFEEINWNWCLTHQEELKKNNPFINGGNLLLHSCSLAQGDFGRDFPQCLADTLNVNVYAAPCVIMQCISGQCYFKDIGNEVQIFTPSDGSLK